MFKIHVVPVGDVDRAIVEFLPIALSESLGVNCLARNANIELSDTYNHIRQQYESTRILSKLTKLDDDEKTKILGIADVDLFIPILTFVFGEAQLGKRVALMSVYRLRQSFYGLPENEPLFYERCEKEAIHEVGHTLGLVHCQDFECVMHYSNSIEQVDLKSNSFCGECARLIRLNTGHKVIAYQGRKSKK